MNAQLAHRVWMMRVARGRENAQDAMAGVLAVDLGVRGDVSQAWNLEEAVMALEYDSPGMSRSRIESRSRALAAMVGDMLPGDLVVAPVRDLGKVLICRAGDGVTVSGTGLPARRVDLIAAVDAAAIPADLVNSLSAHSAVCEIRVPGAWSRVMSLTGAVSTAAAAPPDPGLALTGHEMAEIVAGILSSDGHICHLSPPGPDGGVDILAGKGLLALENTLVVQVKSGRIVSGSEEVDRLLGVMAARGASAALLASYGGFTRPALARTRDLWCRARLWDGRDISKYAARAAPYLDARLAEIAITMSRADAETER